MAVEGLAHLLLGRGRVLAQQPDRGDHHAGGAIARAKCSAASSIVHASSGMSGPGWATIRLAGEAGWRRTAVDRSLPGKGYG
jgi:hypothetical protein